MDWETWQTLTDEERAHLEEKLEDYRGAREREEWRRKVWMEANAMVNRNAQKASPQSNQLVGGIYAIIRCALDVKRITNLGQDGSREASAIASEIFGIIEKRRQPA